MLGAGCAAWERRWWASALFDAFGYSQHGDAPAGVPTTRIARKCKQSVGLSQGARDACIGPASLIMHSYLERHQIATQM